MKSQNNSHVGCLPVPPRENNLPANSRNCHGLNFCKCPVRGLTGFSSPAHPLHHRAEPAARYKAPVRAAGLHRVLPGREGAHELSSCRREYRRGRTCTGFCANRFLSQKSEVRKVGHESWTHNPLILGSSPDSFSLINPPRRLAISPAVRAVPSILGSQVNTSRRLTCWRSWSASSCGSYQEDSCEYESRAVASASRCRATA